MMFNNLEDANKAIHEDIGIFNAAGVGKEEILEQFTGDEFSIDENGFHRVSWHNTDYPEGFEAWVEVIQNQPKAKRKKC